MKDSYHYTKLQDGSSPNNPFRRRHANLPHEPSSYEIIPDVMFSPTTRMGFFQNHKFAFIISLVLAVLSIVVLAAVLIVTLKQPKSIEKSNVGYYSKLAVATDNKQCSELGKDILMKNGTAVDAAIASMYCACIFNFQSCGIGGGFFMVIHQKPNTGSKKVFKEINAREVAPIKATKDMYKNTSSQLGGLSIGVPREVKGTYVAWKEFGRLPWKTLITPTVNWLKNGFEVSLKLGYYIKRAENLVRTNHEFTNIFVKKDGSLMKEGDTVKMPKLATTMQKIADDPDSFYNGDLAEDIVQDLKDGGSIISLEDLQTQQVDIKDSYKQLIPGIGLTIHSVMPSGSGPVIAYMLRMLDAINMSKDDLKDIKSKGNVYHKITEVLKFGFAAKTYMGDDNFVDNSEVLGNISKKEFVENSVSRITLDATHSIEYYKPSPISSPVDKGTSHLSVLGSDGSAVAATTTINLGFGSGVLGSRTGILFNNEMDDFSIPKLRTTYGNTNFIEPGKKPMSSMLPSIYTDNEGKVRFVMGASGGPTITSSNLWVLAHRLWLNYTLEDAINMARFHHQLTPNKITYDADFNQEIINELRYKGHDTFMADSLSTLSVMQGIDNRCDPLRGIMKDCITAVSDNRKGGKPAGV